MAALWPREPQASPDGAGTATRNRWHCLPPVKGNLRAQRLRSPAARIAGFPSCQSTQQPEPLGQALAQNCSTGCWHAGIVPGVRVAVEMGRDGERCHGYAAAVTGCRVAGDTFRRRRSCRRWRCLTYSWLSLECRPLHCSLPSVPRRAQ